MMLRPIVYLILLMLPLSLAAQAPTTADTVAKPFKPNFKPASLRIGTDILALVNSNVQAGFKGWELAADTEIHRYLLVADFGHSEEDISSDSASYGNKGNYWRIGIDANFLTRDPDKNVFFIGLHYGRSSYDEGMTFIPTAVEQQFWGSDAIISYSNRNMKAGWLELNTGLKVQIWKGIHLGYTARFKFGLSQDKSRDMLTHSVPGYGSTDRETAWGFSYYIFYRIPFRPTTSILPPKK